ncbi:FtsK/SpoIIIE domain-containing protein [Streptomyces sp. NPDC057101]|uniref:FtsK/SpoIIIE domain-containing protein n=1 Tax=Streptomyces sp. NPDC057101 TaxID=3346020 RepID=UPI00363174D5
MQIRLTVLAPYAGHGTGRACDVLVTAPAGTALAAVASNLAAAVTGPDTSASGTTVLYAGAERLDPRRTVLGEPPLVDGAVLSLQVPGPDDRVGEKASARLHVVAGPDAGGVHLLHGGPIRIGRSVDADVPLDDPDVSRAHCVVTVGEDGRVTVADRGSTNGTTLDGEPVGDRPVRFAPGALLRLGESALRLTGAGDDLRGTDARATAPDGEGHLRIACGAGGPDGTARTDRPAHAGVPGAAPGLPTDDATHGGAGGALYGGAASEAYADPYDAAPPGDLGDGPEEPAADGARQTRGEAPTAPTRAGGRRGLGAWARRLAGGREELPASAAGPRTAPDTHTGARPGTRARDGVPAPGPAADTWPDPATLLLTALGPGPRLWERDEDHPESLVVRLGTTDRAELSGVPVTVGLREAGSLGLAGPADRLAGLTRSVVAQLAALHSPSDLEIVLISADRNRSLDERRRAWGWLGWLPHVRPAHGQDCRLLLAYDREQAQARTAELTRRLDDGPLGPGWPSADRASVAEAAARHEGPRTVVVVDGDPGSAALRETVARLAGAGAAAGIHLLCLAEAPSASPVSPVAATYETACAASLAFRECGAAVLLSGDVATALRLLRTAGGRVAGHGTVGVVDAVSVAWAERFGRALAPLRTDTTAVPGARAAALPPSARLLDELGLARATPASLMARWASAGDGTAVLGAGPRGPLAVDLTREGPHLLIEGPAGSGRTELLRSIAASLAAGGRPDRLGLLLVDGAGGERGEGLAACTELPHVTEHLVASDPVRMREFAQALGAELKRRAELIGDGHFADRRGTRGNDRLIGQRAPSAAESVPQGARVTVRLQDADDVDGRTSGRTLRTGDGTIGALPSSRGGRADDLGGRPSGRITYGTPEGRANGRPTPPEERDTGRTPYPGDLDDRPGARTAHPADDSRPSRTPYPGDVDHRASGRTPYPGDLDSRPSSRTSRTGDLDSRASGRTSYPADDFRPGGRTPYPGDVDNRPSSRTPYPGDVDNRPGSRTSRTGDLDSRASGRTSRPGDLDSRPSGRTPYPGDLDSRPSGRTPYPGDLDSRPSGRTPYPGDHDNRPGSRTSYPGGDELGGRAGGRTAYPGGDDLGARPSGRTAYPGGDPGGRPSSRTLRTGDGDLGDQPSGRAPRARTGGLTDHSGGRVPRPGAEDPGGHPGGRSPRPGAEDLGGPSSGRVPRPAAGDLTDHPGGRVPRPGDGSLDGRSGVRARPDALLADSPSGRLPRRDGGALDDRPSSRTLRTGDGDLTERPSGRVPRPAGEDSGGRSSRAAGDEAGGRIPRPATGEPQARAGGPAHLPRLVVLVDDFDALVAPALGASGRPAAGSVVRALEAVARNGERLGVHLVATSARPDRTADTELAHGARLRIVLDAPPVTAGPDVPAAGRGRLGHPDGRVTPFQAGRVTGRIPRTATLRPTVVPLEWERMGDPPTRRPVRELGNGPTDLALLASALDRAARSVEATPVPPLTPSPHG